MHIYLLIALGGAGGALSRYGIGRAVNVYLAQIHWPLATFLVNFIGSFTIGAVYVLITEKSSLHTDWRYVLMVGFLGAFTTFSTFSLESVALLEAGKVVSAAVYMSGTLACCVLACWLGMIATR
ncbi:Putative fluoride ion transporter CrcB [Zhongshania aliphaticivorans]|uniref:Fluoride-specific ion channel FluC n=1 Tax=Zhongshania aliphaticivorans TaxID=1470434 RepID=A0A5S9NX03_9GAMM|nr:fluoride efflux transporter CrcB [Zhongshania aliphaticivorans]CAA0088815.1 Putative fluoride ion transporter CrcB [Zhongshania aliphaticivorans]CAA0095198.1 Putative fluoride ion transporter CrcB [Zhongshania aliphaticivorans]